VLVPEQSNKSLGTGIETVKFLYAKTTSEYFQFYLTKTWKPSLRPQIFLWISWKIPVYQKLN